MPKISDIQETPNPNAVKFVLKEPVSSAPRSFQSAEEAAQDPLAKALFDLGHVVSVFYMDRMITVEKDDEIDWDELLPKLAEPIRAAASINEGPPPSMVEKQPGNGDDPRLQQINQILDERIRPALVGDGGWLEVVALDGNTLTVHYQGACGSCPASISGTLMAIESILQREVDPDLEVIAI
ncbi:NifU family protein [Pyrinomonas methylaliphatogenes]|jgi:Fe-S cluster biogenesis protein NfuA|uniref:Thioredoxin-like protein n=1 Tax=Pyrinomonas methylaliphatogenes TaxID=454194 RepID=A0A0B6WW46_9BACT|nr:NifU family protein [Pyrinomonas methylaliphatogenes]MBX5478627.1 NifU family protein [Pyrinomonas methylaliphatogenes]CDM65316.1 thioredoxin-like protein [Pyrinomonas methylaliphatogenes]